MLICIWPHFHGQNMNTWGLPCSYFLLWHPSTCSFLTHESLPSTLLSRSGPMGVPLTVPYNNDITALPACQPGREKKEMLIVISISPLTQNISGSVHVDNRSQVVRSVCDLCFFSPPISGLGWMRTVYTRSVEQWKTERSKQVFPLINTELFFSFPNRLINNCDSARSKHLCKQQLLGTFHIRISQSAEARASADVGCEQNT